MIFSDNSIQSVLKHSLMTGMKDDAALSEHFVQRLIASQCVTVSSWLCLAQTFYIFKVVFVNIIKESNKQLQSTKKSSLVLRN